MITGELKNKIDSLWNTFWTGGLTNPLEVIEHLWYDFLRQYPVKIYRQRMISGFIADFYCASAKLVIELDGSQHFTPDGLAYDRERTNILNQLDIQVIRFTNHQIDTKFDAVCAEIDRVITARRE